MKKEDIDFLKKLQDKLLTQDTMGQANPRFWTIKQPLRVYGINNRDECDGTEVVNNCELIANNLEELVEYLNEHEEDLNIKYEDTGIAEQAVILDDKNEEILKEFFAVYQLVDYMHEELGYSNHELYAVNYKEIDVIVENTMFLTLEECEKHLKNNAHHYKNAYPYAMTAWRSPQVEKLYEILENTTWDKINT